MHQSLAHASAQLQGRGLPHAATLLWLNYQRRKISFAARVAETQHAAKHLSSAQVRARRQELTSAQGPARAVLLLLAPTPRLALSWHILTVAKVRETKIKDDNYCLGLVRVSKRRVSNCREGKGKKPTLEELKGDRCELGVLL